jgi:phosphoribosylformimino-5-aminoimidazole carboxamide ribotide isomerase
MKIIPAIDIIDGKCVRLTQGDYAQKTIYNENPVEVAKTFQDAGLRYLHLVDLDGAKAGAVTNWRVIEEITSKTSLQVDFGGGVKTEEEIQKLLDLGIAQINFGSIAIKRPYRIYEWMEKFGTEKIILSADVKDEQVKFNGWQDDAAVGIELFIKGFHLQGLHYVTCTDISTDGMLTGPNINLYKKIIGWFPEINLIASGGVGSIHDLYALKKTAIYGVIIGKAIYENKISLNELRAINEKLE